MNKIQLAKYMMVLGGVKEGECNEFSRSSKDLKNEIETENNS